MGRSDGPPSLGTFLLRMELKKRIGMSLEEFRRLPWREAEDYLVYIQLLNQQEQMQQQQRRSHSGR